MNYLILFNSIIVIITTFSCCVIVVNMMDNNCSLVFGLLGIITIIALGAGLIISNHYTDSKENSKENQLCSVTANTLTP